MGLSKEILRPETRMTFPPVNPSSSEIKINILPTKEDGVKARIKELSQLFFAKSEKEEETGDQPQEKTSRKDGFEPFVNPQPSEDPLFVNGYNGNFAQKMELNRMGIERVLKIAHLDGKVVLTQFIPPRKSSFEAQGNELAAKRFRLFGKKTQEAEEENPFRRVVPTPEGWRIEINDTRIREELEEKNLAGEKLQTEFTQQFNRQLRQGVWGCVWREKLSSKKDNKYFKSRVFYSLFPIVIVTPVAFLFVNHPFLAIPFGVGSVIGGYLLFNWIGGFRKRKVENDENELKKVDPSFIPRGTRGISHFRRNVDHPLEYFMPSVEIDKVARSWAFLSLKGKTLVKEMKQPENK